MDIGMMWFDDSTQPLKEKIKRAADYYAEKYGRRPTTCLVNPQTLNGGEGSMAGVDVRRAASVMPHHYWIGVEEAEVSKRGPRRKKAA